MYEWAQPWRTNYSRPVFITDFVLLGDQEMAHPDIINQFNIRAVVRMAAKYELPPDVQSYTLWIDDDPETNIAQYFYQIFNFIDSFAERGQRVLVHCAAGISRSATVVIAYLMQLERRGLEAAFDKVKQLSPIICPNTGFMKQLREYEQELNTPY